MERTLQLDAFFKDASRDILALIMQEPSSVQRQVNLANVILAYGQYGMRDAQIMNMMRDAQQMILRESWVSSNVYDDLVKLAMLFKGYSLVEHRRTKPKPDPVDYSVMLDKTSSKAVGIKYTVRGGAGSLPVQEPVSIGKAAWKWNKEHPDWAIEQHDEINVVNTISGTASQLSHALLHSEGIVTLTLQRNTSRQRGGAAKSKTRLTQDGHIPQADFFRELAQRVYQTLCRMEAANVGAQFRTMANLLQACAVLQVDYPPLLDVLTKFACRRSNDFGSIMVAQLLWVYSKYPPSRADDDACVETLINAIPKLISGGVVKGTDGHSEEFVLSMLYQGMTKLGRPADHPVVIKTVEAASHHGISLATLKNSVAVPPTWD
eukprot:TRINITY_DN40222_c0_g1_i1.p1 TRINITY_DN40222_c0_g1~~TRINITY_DN40222_c0_g1_i1.p1  ORF type:complete len:377 (-),score=49.62 TRINITY_DN40222_c0_g1_i1:92-1222(-)